MKEDIAALTNILRFILVKTVRESTFFVPKPLVLAGRSAGTIEGREARGGETVISDEELDKSIQELIAEYRCMRKW